MKTTVEIEPRLLQAAKRAAVDRHSTLKALIESGLRRELAAKPARLDWTEFPVASGPWPEGLDISSREKMWEWIASGTTGGGDVTESAPAPARGKPARHGRH